MQRIAFVIGSNGPSSNNSDNLPSLQFAKQDAKRIKEVLKSPKVGYSVKTVPDDCESNYVLSYFEDIANTCEQGDDLLFYFSGHGHLLHGQLYLIWDKTNLEFPVTTTIPINTIKSIFANAKAYSRIIILDCCHSGSEEIFKSIQMQQNEPLNEAAKTSSSIIISACGRTAMAREILEWKSGFLTHILISALTDKFHDADADNDGSISIHDLSKWLKEETIRCNANRKYSGKIEFPEIYGKFHGDVYLTRYLLENDETHKRLRKAVYSSVEKLREEMKTNKILDNKTAEKLARPIGQAAPTFTNLNILNELFEINDSATIFAAAVILYKRRDPKYMEQLISRIDSQLHLNTTWRILRAVKDTMPFYDLTENGKEDLVRRLQNVAKQYNYMEFKKGYTVEMIRKVVDKLKVKYNVSYEDVFSVEQIARIPVIPSKKKI